MEIFTGIRSSRVIDTKPQLRGGVSGFQHYCLRIGWLFKRNSPAQFPERFEISARDFGANINRFWGLKDLTLAVTEFCTSNEGSAVIAAPELEHIAANVFGSDSGLDMYYPITGWLGYHPDNNLLEEFLKRTPMYQQTGTIRGVFMGTDGTIKIWLNNKDFDSPNTSESALSDLAAFFGAFYRINTITLQRREVIDWNKYIRWKYHPSGRMSETEARYLLQESAPIFEVCYQHKQST